MTCGLGIVMIYQETDFLLQLFCPSGFLPWEFGLLSPGKASCDTVALPNPRCVLGALVFLQSTELRHGQQDLYRAHRC